MQALRMESPGKLLKILMPILHFRTVKSEFMALRSLSGLAGRHRRPRHGCHRPHVSGYQPLEGMVEEFKGQPSAHLLRILPRHGQLQRQPEGILGGL